MTDKYVLVPCEATAENGMKAQFMGEYVVRYPELGEDGEDRMRQINIPWTVLKDIYRDMVKFGADYVQKLEGAE